MHIVLHEPEIPGNTGNIGRSCVVTGTSLHLIEPLGFEITEKQIRRSGLDYWKDLDVHTYSDYEDFLKRNPGAKIWYATTKAHKTYTEVSFAPDDYIMFGKESAGIPGEILVDNSGVISEGNLSIATPERAFLDTLYLNSNYYFDNPGLLDKEKILALLPLYGSKTLSERVYKFIG